MPNVLDKSDLSRLAASGGSKRNLSPPPPLSSPQTMLPSSTSVPQISHLQQKVCTRTTLPAAAPTCPNGVGVVNYIPAPASQSAEEESKREELVTKWRKIIETNYTILVSFLRKADKDSGLGISLEGTVDVEEGQEVRPHHYIRSILPGGAVGMDGSLQAGDELLEVNDD
jgi:hypothetical protein